jgi:hypothetical protein
MFPCSAREPAYNKGCGPLPYTVGSPSPEPPSGFIPPGFPTKTLCMRSGSQGSKIDVGCTAYKPCLVRMARYSSQINEAVVSSETSAQLYQTGFRLPCMCATKAIHILLLHLIILLRFVALRVKIMAVLIIKISPFCPRSVVRCSSAICVLFVV